MTLEIYEDHAGLHRWRLVARNGRIIADSGEGYCSPSNARRAFARVEDACKHGEVLAEDVVQ